MPRAQPDEARKTEVAEPSVEEPLPELPGRPGWVLPAVVGVAVVLLAVLAWLVMK